MQLIIIAIAVAVVSGTKPAFSAGTILMLEPLCGENVQLGSDRITLGDSGCSFLEVREFNEPERSGYRIATECSADEG